MNETAEQRADRWYSEYEKMKRYALDLDAKVKKRDAEIAELKEEVSILKLAVRWAMKGGAP